MFFCYCSYTLLCCIRIAGQGCQKLHSHLHVPMHRLVHTVDTRTYFAE